MAQANGRKQVEDYLASRLSRDDYRGVHFAQHNRLPEDKLLALLEAIRSAVGLNRFDVPPGDDTDPTRRYDPAAPGDAANWPDYNRILIAIFQSDNDITATFNSLKKNHFVNLDAMGLLGRSEDPPQAWLLPAAIEILEARPVLRSSLVGAAMTRLFEPEFLEHIRELLETLDSLSVHELQLFVTDAHTTLDDQRTLIRAYRRLRRLDRLQIHQEVRESCDETMHLPSKVDKRDWSNWKNESQQLLSMLAYVPAFKVYSRDQVMLAGSHAAEVFLPRRSQTVKAEALAWHDLASEPGWELHHIFPVAYATSEADMAQIDAKENLIQLTARAHSQIDRRENRSVAMRYSDDRIYLYNPVSGDREPEVLLTIGTDARVKRANLEAMQAYNACLLDQVP